jgi:hypothetical protein
MIRTLQRKLSRKAKAEPAFRFYLYDKICRFPPETKAWTERPFHTTHRGHRRDEAPQSKVRLCPHRPADQLRFWYQN